MDGTFFRWAVDRLWRFYNYLFNPNRPAALVTAGTDVDTDRGEARDVAVGENRRISQSIVMFPDKKLAKRRHVVAGKICSGLISRPCVIKCDPNQFVKEVKALVQLGAHPNIVGLIAFGTFHEFQDISYIVLEKYHDLNLDDYVSSQTIKPIYDINRGLEFCKQIITGMKFVHEKLIIHKDLKPSNILLSYDLKNIIIADFGSSQEANSSSSMARCPGTFGTLGYRPPESLVRSFVSLKSDYFSLGVVFYYLLSKGKSPFGPESDKWDHNTQTCTIDISCLLVTNPLATQFLIKSMLNEYQLRRPSIEEIGCHRSWNGEEFHGDLDEQQCGFEEEHGDDLETVRQMQSEEEVTSSERKFQITLEHHFNSQKKRKAESKRVISQGIREEDTCSHSWS